MNPQDLADALGITPARLREVRDTLRLSEGCHWIRDPKDFRRVSYTRLGVEALRAALGAPEISSPDHPPETEKLASAPAKDQGACLETVTVISRARQFPDGSFRHFSNPRVILCRRESGESIHVRVADSRNWIPVGADGKPMTLQAQFTGDPPHWCLVGRCPRYPGRF